MDLSLSTFFYFKLLYTECSYAYSLSRYLVQKRASQIGGYKVCHNL